MTMLRRLIRSVFNFTIAPVLALVLIFEEWGWEPLQKLVARFARLPLWARLESFITRLPPYAAMAVFFVPMLLLLPVKLLALYWISRGHAVLGILVVLAAKLLGTAMVARLFALTQPALMQLAWFASWYGHWKHWKDALIAHVKGTMVWRAAAANVRACRKWMGW